MGGDLLVGYALRIAPALALAALLAAVLRANRNLRIVIYIAVFVVIRDAMTPMGFWSFGGEGLFWIRFNAPPATLSLLGIGSAAMVILLFSLDRGNRERIRWFRNSPGEGLAAAVSAVVIVCGPLVAYYLTVPVTLRGGPVARSLLPSIAVLALLGNLLEEVLFRGLVLEVIAKHRQRLTAGVLSGVVFAFCHVFLAITVTDVGIPLLAFTLWEGVLAGMVGSRYGVVPATVTHGGAIFILAAGLL